MLTLTVKSSGSTIPVLKSIICNIYVKHKVLTVQTTGEDYFINPQTRLTQPFENHVNPATDILLSPTAMRLAKEPFSISPWKANLR